MEKVPNYSWATKTKTNVLVVRMRLVCGRSGASVEIGYALARESALINGSVEIFGAEEDDEIPVNCRIPVELEVLQCIKSYCESRQPHGPSFHIALSDEQLVQLLVASDFLAIEGLLDLACKEFGTVLDACTAEEIRTRFHIPNDIAEDEAQALDAEDEWLTEKPNTELAGRPPREIYAAIDGNTEQLIQGLPEVMTRLMTENTQAALNRVEGAGRAGDGTRACVGCPLATDSERVEARAGSVPDVEGSAQMKRKLIRHMKAESLRGRLADSDRLDLLQRITMPALATFAALRERMRQRPFICVAGGFGGLLSTVQAEHLVRAMQHMRSGSTKLRKVRRAAT